MTLRIGTAGWTIPKLAAEQFAGAGSHLQRYARRMNAVEINSSFYRPHRKTTYERWAATTPDDFEFSVKIPKQITHEKRLRDCADELKQFLDEVGGLDNKLGPLLIQLPPSLAWNETITRGFFTILRAAHSGAVVCEPRHVSWFGDEPTRQLAEFGIGQVAADPSVVAGAAVPGGDFETCYFRWHGSPRIYYSSYDLSALAALTARLIRSESLSRDVWCIFDNTAEGAAIQDALELMRLVTQAGNGRENY
jgi:uncharacterized protein YecE (DUF72 family)